MFLADLLSGVEVVRRVGASNPEVQEIQFDSKKVRKGDVFVALVGTRADGHRFIHDAIGAGAVVVVVERLPDTFGDGVTYVQVADTAGALGILANNYYGRPSQSMAVVGVTGTNGKTTTATLLHRLFSSLGFRCGLLSTIRNYAGDSIVPSTHTTGDALQIASLMGRMVAAGCTHCFMEVTSHAIHQRRISGVEFDGAIFTNLSHDHLDYHGSMEAYYQVKKSFFDGLPSTAFALSNADDAVGSAIIADSPARRYLYGQKTNVEFSFEVIRAGAFGLEVKIDGSVLESAFLGLFNAYNLAAVHSSAVLLGVDPSVVTKSLAAIPPVEGRMERVSGPRGLTVVVDFAHTPDALAKALAAIRAFSVSNKVICVIGCGGDRDKDKRPLMAQVAVELSDQAIFTSDNPRSEEPASIVAEMLAGIEQSNRQKVNVILDRREAIREACASAAPGSVILVAGKGHEKYQEIRGQKRPFDDVEEARSALSRLDASAG